MGRIGLIGENSVEYVDRLLNIWNSGDCAVLIDWRIPLQTAIEMLKEANVQICYIEEKLFVPTISYGELTIRKYNVTHGEPILLPSSFYVKYAPNNSRDEAVIIYSSGTTGKSKGIVLSHYAISINADSILDYMAPTDNDTIYTIRLFSHSSTLTGELLVALRSKCKLLIAQSIILPRFVYQNIAKFSVTILGVNPTILSLLADHFRKYSETVPSLRTIYVSGSILSDSIYNKAHSVFENVKVYNVYGLTEAGPRVSAQRENCCRNNSVGKPIKNVEVAIVDDNGIPTSVDIPGYVHVYTPSLYTAYTTGSSKNPSLYKNWLNTGDIGYFDRFGELHITNRSDDVIISDSYKIYPGDVEKTILKITSLISECIVTGVNLDDRIVIACLYVGAHINEYNIKHKLSHYLPKYEIPSLFINCNQLPKTLTGKISRIDAKKYILNYISSKKQTESQYEYKKEISDMNDKSYASIQSKSGMGHILQQAFRARAFKEITQEEFEKIITFYSENYGEYLFDGNNINNIVARMIGKRRCAYLLDNFRRE